MGLTCDLLAHLGQAGPPCSQLPECTAEPSPPWSALRLRGAWSQCHPLQGGVRTAWTPGVAAAFVASCQRLRHWEDLPR